MKNPLFSHSMRGFLALLLFGAAFSAEAFTATITPGTRAIYLRVGTGSATGNYSTGGTMQNNATIDDVRVTLTPAQLLSTTPVQMTSTSSQGGSYYDGHNFCNLAPAQVYVGGFFRRPTTAGNAILTATAPQTLTNGTGQTIDFSEISWTAAGNGDTGAQPIPAGTFAGGSQTLATFPSNSFRESCHTFTYANSDVIAAGTYTGRVVYTLSAP